MILLLDLEMSIGYYMIRTLVSNIMAVNRFARWRNFCESRRRRTGVVYDTITLLRVSLN